MTTRGDERHEEQMKEEAEQKPVLLSQFEFHPATGEIAGRFNPHLTVNDLEEMVRQIQGQIINLNRQTEAQKIEIENHKIEIMKSLDHKLNILLKATSETGKALTRYLEQQ